MKKIILLALCLILVAGIAIGFYTVKKNDQKNTELLTENATLSPESMGFLISANTKQDIIKKSEGRFELDDITNILLIGVDNDNLGGMDSLGNADGIMLVSVNKNTQQLTLTSIMRDTKIRQPNEYEKKITSIYHAGGAKLLIEAIELNFGVHINNYILVNYLNVIDIADALGGFDIELSADEIKAMSPKIKSLERLKGIPAGTNAISVDQAGMLHLNGLQTSAYMRIRPESTNYDSGRTERARKVVAMMLEKVRKLSVGKKKQFAEKFIPNVETDMSDADLLAFSNSASVFMDYKLYSAKIPLDGAYKNSNDGNAFIIPDFEVNNKYLYESIYEGKH